MRSTSKWQANGLENPLATVAHKARVQCSRRSSIPTRSHYLPCPAFVEPQYDVSSQDTFVVGLIAELGKTHTLLNAPVLRVVEDTTQVRFSHRNVIAPEDYSASEQAIASFKQACELVANSIVVEPGDLLLVSNRTCLHGRGVVGEEVGGIARWLLRTYALDTSNLDEARRHGGDRPLHVLYP